MIGLMQVSTLSVLVALSIFDHTLPDNYYLHMELRTFPSHFKLSHLIPIFAILDGVVC